MTFHCHTQMVRLMDKCNANNYTPSGDIQVYVVTHEWISPEWISPASYVATACVCSSGKHTGPDPYPGIVLLGI